MKKLILPFFVMAVVSTGCSTYRYTARTTDVNRRAIETKDAAVEVVPDYSRTVKAKSDFQLTPRDAMAEAEYRCIVENNIDVVIDPIFKIERAPVIKKNKYIAEVSGYAGVYKNTKAGVEAAQDYQLSEIEKFKLLNDPNFAKYYYSKGNGDTYFINSNPQTPAQKMSSLAFAPKREKKNVRTYDYGKSLRLRNAGIGLTTFGVVSTFLIGVTCYTTADKYDSYGRYHHNSAQAAAGSAFMAIGSVSTVAGITMWSVGASHMKKADKQYNLSLGGSNSGMGLKLNF